jgi:hypothetical protein
MLKNKSDDKIIIEEPETLSRLNEYDRKFQYRDQVTIVKNAIVRPSSSRYDEPDPLSKSPLARPASAKYEPRSKTPAINNRKEIGQYNSNVSTNSNSNCSNNANIYKPKIPPAAVNLISNDRANIQNPVISKM